MRIKDNKKIAFVTQTTLSVDDTKGYYSNFKKKIWKYKRTSKRRYLLRNNK